MSVISSVTVTPNRIEIIARYLESLGEGGIARDDLLARLSPRALRKAGAAGDGEEVGEGRSSVPVEALAETLRLGIAERFDDNGTERVRYAAVPVPFTGSLLERLESILLDADKAEASGQREFRRALAWFLTQNPERPIDSQQGVRSKIEDQCGTEVNVFELTSPPRAQNFYYWVRYLGYGWYVDVGGDSPTMIVPDPTAALARHLSHMMSPGQTWPLTRLVQEWGDVSPVLEGGSARSEVENLLLPTLRRKANMLSRSTSIAIQRLDQRGVIRLDRQADAQATLLDCWPDPLPFSHITYLRMANR